MGGQRRFGTGRANVRVWGAFFASRTTPLVIVKGGIVKKTLSLFQRNYETDRLVRNEVVPGAEWVIAGEGIATRKYDGTCCMIKDGKLFKRYEAKKQPPADFIPAQDQDTVTGHWVGWRPCYRDDPNDKYHWEAFDVFKDKAEGTYELLGPKIQGNPEKMSNHVLLKHSDAEVLADCPEDFDGLKLYLKHRDIEGVVWHHQDGRMVKIKKRDFGFRR
jgi:hypothetical protein